MGKIRYDKHNVLVIGDTHIPFEHHGYMDFCLDIKKKERCGTVVHIGDLVDNHSISYHEHDPDLWSPAQEMENTDKILKKWFKAFPELKITKGNHDCLVDRKGKTVGLPKRCFKPYRDIWELPGKWEDGFSFIIDNVLYQHGTKTSGRLAHFNQAVKKRMSVVQGHLPAFAGITFTASERDCIFGMNVGCGIHAASLAFAYGVDFPEKPIVSCAAVYHGEDPQIFRMRL
jgi:predicted phosphodiesterase